MRQGVVVLFLVFGVLYFVQGVNETATGLVTQPVQSLLKNWQYDDDDVTAFMALLSVPWCLKPFFGLLSDFVPLAGRRRKSYLVAAGAVTSVCFIGLTRIPLAPGSRWLLLAGLMVPTLAVTFGDVVLDALIIEAGQLRGITDRLQSVRWGASYLAMVLTGSTAGLLTQANLHEEAFLICGLLAAAALGLLTFVREPPPAVVHEDFKAVMQTLLESIRSRKLLAVGAFLFAWHLNPCTQTVVYLQMTKTLHLSEQLAGNCNTLLAIGATLACLFYSFYCRRLPMKLMIPGSVAIGILSNLFYLLMRDGTSAALVSLAVGFSYMSANMIQCDLAARVCPIHAAGTMFAVLMALCNIGTTVSMWLGGELYAGLEELHGSRESFQAVLLIGAGLIFCSWPISRLIPHDADNPR